MANALESIILGIIQGIAEWLPISSTGHLRLAEHFLLRQQVPLLLSITLHVGTLAALLVFFRNDIRNILSALYHRDFKSENGKLIPLIIAGSVPTAIIGFALSDTVESLSQQILPIAIALLLSGTLLYTSRFAKEKTENVTYPTALAFGIAQGLAVMPGLSRSGTTLAVALLLGLKRDKAFRFSFLLSIPAVIGALGLEAYKEREALTQAGFGSFEILVGATAAMLVGYVALIFVHKTVEDKRFHLFAFYCWLLGMALVALSMNGF